MSHVQADPLQRLELATLDLSKFKCAIVLCDERWLDPDNDDLNGIDTLDEPSVLRLDSLMMVVQVRGCWCAREHGCLGAYLIEKVLRKQTTVCH